VLQIMENCKKYVLLN